MPTKEQITALVDEFNKRANTYNAQRQKEEQQAELAKIQLKDKLEVLKSKGIDLPAPGSKGFLKALEERTAAETAKIEEALERGNKIMSLINEGKYAEANAYAQGEVEADSADSTTDVEDVDFVSEVDSNEAPVESTSVEVDIEESPEEVSEESGEESSDEEEIDDIFGDVDFEDIEESDESSDEDEEEIDFKGLF